MPFSTLEERHRVVESGGHKELSAVLKDNRTRDELHWIRGRIAGNFSPQYEAVGRCAVNAFLVLVEVVVKCGIGLVSGAGIGTLVFGIGLVVHGVTDFSGHGPPPGPVFIGVGAGLLTTACTMLGLFVGPLSKRRWFVVADVGAELPEKWKPPS